MKRRTFCKTTLAAAIAATLPGCGSRSRDVGSSIPAVTGTGEELSIESAAVTELADSLNGHLYVQADEGYDAAKLVWNGMFDH